MRTDTKITEVFQFNELSDKAKEKARDWFKAGDTFDHDFIFEDAKEVGKILGIDITKIYFSGFSSQGDGACFTGKYSHAEDAVSKIKEYAPLDTKLHDIAILLDLCNGVNAEIQHSDRYYHSNTMTFCFDGLPRDEESIIKDALKSFADWIYSQLNKEYDWTQTNEYVDDCIVANEYEFTKDGARYA